MVKRVRMNLQPQWPKHIHDFFPQKYLGDKYLFMMVGMIVTPTLLLLIIQVTAFPLRLHAHEVTNEVGVTMFVTNNRLMCTLMITEYILHKGNLFTL